MQIIGLGHLLFAAGMIGLGVLGLIYGDFAPPWQRVPDGIPWREGLAYASAAVMLVSGIGLFLKRAAPLASRVLLVYVLLWFLLLQIPPLALDPLAAGAWGSLAEVGQMLAGGSVLFAVLGAPRGGLEVAVREKTISIARIIFGCALPFNGLVHFAYAEGSARYWVPAWLPWHLGWVYLSGAGFIAAGIGILFGIYPRLAAAMVVGQMAGFTLLDWLPNVLGSRYAPPLLSDPSSVTTRFAWTGLFISWSITAGAWVVADSYRGTPWLAASGAYRRASEYIGLTSSSRSSAPS
jgi:uncharacterized membrane protein